MTQEAGTLIADVFGWVMAALAGAWAWIVRWGVMGRIDSTEGALASKANKVDCERHATDNQRGHDSLARAVDDLRDRLDTVASEIRGSVDSTRNELKSDLRLAIDLLRKADK